MSDSTNPPRTTDTTSTSNGESTDERDQQPREGSRSTGRLQQLWAKSTRSMLQLLQCWIPPIERRSRTGDRQDGSISGISVEYPPDPDDTADSAIAAEPDLQFQLDSLALQECYDSVCTDPSVESLVYLTGPEQAETRVVSKVFEVEPQWQSRVGVEADPDLQFEVLQELSNHGHNLLAYCHNHPGRGRRSIEPSDDDMATQRRLEALGHEAIGLIMTRDGYVNAFSDSLSFELDVYGDNVDRVDETTLYLHV